MNEPSLKLHRQRRNNTCTSSGHAASTTHSRQQPWKPPSPSRTYSNQHLQLKLHHPSRTTSNASQNQSAPALRILHTAATTNLHTIVKLATVNRAGNATQQPCWKTSLRQKPCWRKEEGGRNPSSRERKCIAICQPVNGQSNSQLVKS